MNDRNTATAARFGITEQCAALQRDLLTIPGAVKVEFDLDGFYDHMEQVILLVKFDIPAANRNYFRDLRALRQGVIDTAARHGLTRTPDTIENYGEHLYFVFHHDKTWDHPAAEQPNTAPAAALRPYYVTISETLSRSVIIWADSSEAANEKAADLCNAGEIDLTASDFANREIQCDGVASKNDLNTAKQYGAENNLPNAAAKANFSHYGYSSEEIAATLGKAAGLEGTALAESAEKALYRLKTICENPMNDDSYRDLWNLLERVALNIEDTAPDVE